MLFRAKDEGDAVRIANDSPFGLGGSVFTSDIKHGAEVAKKISTGMVFVNHPTMVKADLPLAASAALATGANCSDSASRNSSTTS
jgi:succinate-semialdehyde dehydrogenase / glutarate-semialdehyde dehydrogenase